MLSWMRGSTGTVNAASQLLPHALKLSMGTVNGLGRQLRIGDSRLCMS
jgi:hypothetical protein